MKHIKSILSHILMKFHLPRKTLEKYSNIKFRDNPSSRSRVLPRGRTAVQADRHDKAMVAFRNSA
jgi:hypothetical protein